MTLIVPLMLAFIFGAVIGSFLNVVSLRFKTGKGLKFWREHVFAWMSRSASGSMDFFHLPPNRVVELGTQVEL